MVTYNVFVNMVQFYFHFLLRGAAIISALSDVTRLEAVSHKLPFLPTFVVFAKKEKQKQKNNHKQTKTRRERRGFNQHSVKFLVFSRF